MEFATKIEGSFFSYLGSTEQRKNPKNMVKNGDKCDIIIRESETKTPDLGVERCIGRPTGTNLCSKNS